MKGSVDYHKRVDFRALDVFVDAVLYASYDELKGAVKTASELSKDSATSMIARPIWKRLASLLRAELKGYAKNPSRKKSAKKKATRRKNPSKRFTKNQLSQMRKSFSKINKVDPGQPTYNKMIKYLDRLPQSLIKQIAGARIKFLSGLASNRIKGKA